MIRLDIYFKEEQFTSYHMDFSTLFFHKAQADLQIFKCVLPSTHFTSSNYQNLARWVRKHGILMVY